MPPTRTFQLSEPVAGRCHSCLGLSDWGFKNCVAARAAVVSGKIVTHLFCAAHSPVDLQSVEKLKAERQRNIFIALIRKAIKDLDQLERPYATRDIFKATGYGKAIYLSPYAEELRAIADKASKDSVTRHYEARVREAIASLEGQRNLTVRAIRVASGIPHNLPHKHPHIRALIYEAVERSGGRVPRVKGEGAA